RVESRSGSWKAGGTAADQATPSNSREVQATSTKTDHFLGSPKASPISPPYWNVEPVAVMKLLPPVTRKPLSWARPPLTPIYGCTHPSGLIIAYREIAGSSSIAPW